MGLRRHLDMFSGVGAFALGLQRAGCTPVGFVEIDPFCQRVLAKNFPGVPIHDDVSTREFEEGEADIITGGFPCQDVSLAGRRAGLAGKRSGLYRELVRAIRVVRPKHAIVENVAALLSDGMGTVLGDLAEGGVDAEWDCVPAFTVGAPHERDRVWIVAHPHGFDGWPGAGREDGAQAGDGAGERSPPDPDRDGNGNRDGSGSVPRPPGTAEGAPQGQHRQRRGARFGDEPEGSGGETSSAPPHPAGQQMGSSGQPRLNGGVGPSSDAQGVGCGQGRAWRPPDSFARVREQTRRYVADPYGARLAFKEGVTGDAWEKLTPAERDGFGNVGQSIWPDEPALSGVDDGSADWIHRVKATGNCLLPQIPQLIAEAIFEAEGLTA